MGGEICDVVNVSFAVCFQDGKNFSWLRVDRFISIFFLQIANPTVWNCKDNELPSFVNFDKLLVFCENATGPFGDEVVLGSCGMEYSLQVKTIKLISVKTLQLFDDQNTTGFKIQKQLRCVDDKNLCGEHAINGVVCDNLGYINGIIGWKCLASSRNDVKLNRYTVSCENAPGSNQYDIIIKDSCSLR